MGRLSLVPPHLIDMPLIGQSRVIPGGQSYGDAAAIGADFPAMSADFSGWTGAFDGPEQELPPQVFDLDSYFDDEEFWSFNANNATITRWQLTNAGLSQIGSYGIAWPANANPDANAMYDGTVGFLRLTKTSCVIIIPSNQGGNYYFLPIVFQFANGAFTGTSQNGNMMYFGAADSYTSLIARCGWPTTLRLSDTLALFVGRANGSDQFAFLFSPSRLIAGTNAGDAGGRISLQRLQMNTEVFPKPLLAGANRALIANTFFTTGFSQLSTLDLTLGSTPSASQGTVTTPLDDAPSTTDGSTNVQRRAFLPMSANKLLQYTPKNRTISVVAFSATAATVLSAFSIAGLMYQAGSPAEAEHLMSWVRLNATDFLIVTAQAADKQRARTTRLQLNQVDNTISAAQSANNYSIAPYVFNAARQHQTVPDVNGIVLPGNRVLMNSRRFTGSGSQGARFIKLLRAA